MNKRIQDTNNSIQEKQILVINKAMGQPVCALRTIASPDDGLVFQVFLTWNNGHDWLHLQTQEGKSRNFKHFWHFLKWAAAHDIKTVDLERIEITDEIRSHLGLREAGAGAHDGDALRRAGGPDIPLTM